MSQIISIEHLYRSFRSYKRQGSNNLLPARGSEHRIVACDDITLDAKKGELIGLVGPNGSGKTTFLRVLSTVFLPDKGKISIQGFDIVKDSLKVRNLISFVTSHNTNSYARLSGRQNLEFFASFYNLSPEESRKRISILAEQFQVTKYLDIMFQEYSSGIKQRFHLVRGLLSDAPILFLDEPTKSLDPAAAREFCLFLRKEVQQKAKTIIIASHLLSEVVEIADRIAILEKGRLKGYGTLTELENKMGKPNAGIDEIYHYYVNQ